MTRPLTRAAPTSARRDRGSGAFHSSAESQFSGRNERPFRRSTSIVEHQTYPAFSPKPRLNQRSVLKTQISHAEWRDVEQRKKKILERQEVTKRSVHEKHTHRFKSPPFQKPVASGSFTPRTGPSNEEDKAFTQGRNKNQRKKTVKGQVEQQPSVSPAIARSRAIEQKRKEIEEVYRRDCGTFSTVVQKLVSKEPSLVPGISFSMQENLREIGARCAAAMEQFISQYEAKDVSR